MSSARRARRTVQTSFRTSTLIDDGSRLAVLMDWLKSYRCCRDKKRIRRRAYPLKATMIRAATTTRGKVVQRIEPGGIDEREGEAEARRREHGVDRQQDDARPLLRPLTAERRDAPQRESDRGFIGQ